MILVEKVLFLRHVSLFSRMAVADIGRVAEIAEEIICPAETRIFSEGEYGDSLYLIVDGFVQIAHADEQLALLGAKDYFGEMSILDGEPRSATATAAVDSLLLKIRQEDFHQIMATHFDASLAVIKTLSRNLRKHVAMFAHNSGVRSNA